jgi:hypothetical protein
VVGEKLVTGLLLFADVPDLEDPDPFVQGCTQPHPVQEPASRLLPAASVGHWHENSLLGLTLPRCLGVRYVFSPPITRFISRSG